MRLPLVPVLIVLCIGILIDWYILRRKIRPKFVRYAYIAVSGLTTVAMIIVTVLPKKAGSDARLEVMMWCIFAYFSVFIPKLIYRIVCLVRQGLAWLFHRPLRFISVIGAVLSVILFVLMWWGALFTRLSLDVREVTVPVSNLPRPFEGYRMVQISDIHTGTFGSNPGFLARMVEKINSLRPDIILFTGDIVNRRSEELIPFMSTLAGLSAPDGVWSVMGNHDYGEYFRWGSENERLADVGNLKKMQSDMGWNMLNNSHTVLRRQSDSLVLIGVENIGEPPFTTYGSLAKAYPAVSDSSVKILLSHNPSHWIDSIADNPHANIALTLAGHTHAMQVRLLGWSPASFRYHTWGGLYPDSLGRALYVNIGIGEVGFPSRIGATPEITLITLVRK